ncbi:uncharacterized protein MELLADRAFT_74588 [Melampsora larici-populina 98AG31]|uniref:Secreted protein n=1 Tax=Melampsora larici-populina (strain 98AG31 / pathotype 3-4-7) TaxID=747676 RepID=F4RHP5_MELLP|nr:uncharacterized protein MELLADRAFT_74588 [Melampsora larici-populina 98AG31]EGG07858.1 secreted protein [Melampsora larici-populina 98AG31]
MLHKIALIVLLQTVALFQGSQQALTVSIVDKNNFCLVVPKDAHTNIGDSEYPGGEAVWCQGQGQGGSGTFNGPFWSQVEVARPKQGVVQMTGCININSSDRFNANDGGGQYDSNGGDGGRGNPAGSVCKQYPVYVELIEPAANRACIRCCQNAADCDVSRDTSGCPSVIPGNYFGCA